MAATGFQTTVSVVPSPAVAGDFADGNPRYFVDAGPGALVVGSNGLYVGRAAWLDYSRVDTDNAPAIASNSGTGKIAGLVHREQQGLNTTYLSPGSMFVPAGFPITVTRGGSMWVVNDGSTQALVGATMYANFADGKLSFALAGATSTSFTIAAETSSFTGSIAGNVLTVTGAVTGTIYPGTHISGGTIASGTQIISQLGGTAGGDGTYAVSIVQTVSSTTVSGTYGLFTAGGSISGTFGVGDTLTATDVSATTITALGTGTGGAGTYIVDKTQTSSTGTITAALNVATNWIAASSGNAGELVKVINPSLN